MRKNLLHLRSGFSLIELTILLTVVALIAVSSLTFLESPATKEFEALSTTRERLDAIELALENYRVNNGRLPCPADRALADSDPKLGEENCLGVGVQNLGVIPARSLGLNLDYLYDGWGRRFTYHIATTICDVNAVAPYGPTNCTKILYGDGPDTDADYLTVQRLNYPADIDNVAYVIVSHGVNGKGGWISGRDALGAAVGIQRMPGTCIDPVANPEDENCDDDDVYILNPYSSAFDDLVRFRTYRQIENAVLDPDTFVMTQDFCLNTVSASIEDIVGDDSAAGNAAYELDQVTLFAPYSAIDQVLSFMMQLQEICAEYYPTAYASATDRKCPGTGRIYDGSIKACTCPSGQAWDNVSRQCS